MLKIWSVDDIFVICYARAHYQKKYNNIIKSFVDEQRIAWMTTVHRFYAIFKHFEARNAATYFYIHVE